jgi:hypothetical protein
MRLEGAFFQKFGRSEPRRLEQNLVEVCSNLFNIRTTLKLFHHDKWMTSMNSWARLRVLFSFKLSAAQSKFLSHQHLRSFTRQDDGDGRSIRIGVFFRREPQLAHNGHLNKPH